ncbi:MAG: prepilin-type N-terminal cleavage/methylation domain-containing protein [Clostridia bacterium]|nr:prepilin-type N-terminal cleavage/methylation domain-containing protein [Clostridia bacterium]
MNMFKKKDGFTLVELIVVIAILAILAGVAVPAYTGYINKANSAKDITALDAIKTAAQATLATSGTVTSMTVSETGDSVKAAVNNGTETELNTNNNFKLYLTGDAAGTVDVELKTGSSATWNSTSGEWTIS